MNFIHRNDNLGSYRRVDNGVYNFTNWVRNETSANNNNSNNNKSIFSRRKSSHTDTTSDWLTIKIGGNDLIGKKRKKIKNTNRIKSTKYTLYSFLPRNLTEQFQRIANFYFLVMTILGLLIDGPVSPLTSLIPLIFVISVTAFKQGYEDYLRYRTDNIVNFSPVTVIRNGEEEHIFCENVISGDIVMVYRDCDVPCDLVLLKSSDINGRCFITTVNLDGESNLKTLAIPRGLPYVDTTRLHTLGTIVCEKSKFDLYSFNGKILLNSNNNDAQYYTDIENNNNRYVLPLTKDNLLLRGSRVKNTEYVIGCAVYTGMNTKLALNSRLTRNKFSSNEKHINKFLIFILSILIGFATFAYFLKRYYENIIIINHNYLGPPIDTSKLSSFLRDFLSFIILFNYLIPISLYVTIEMTRVLGSFFMEWDYNLYDDETDQPCITNTSNLNEELGQINFLFSDKTGTLTKNEMIFKYCSINGKKYSYYKSKLREKKTQKLFDASEMNEDQLIFFQALAICHTVQLAKTGSESDDSITQKEELLNVVSFTNIAEENNSTNVKNRDKDETSSVHKSFPKSRNTTVEGGKSWKQLLDEKRKNYIKRSPRFAAKKASILPETSPTITVPVNVPQNFRNRNRVAPAVHRSTSHIDLPLTANVSNTSAHRRTVSYGANPNSLQRPVARPTLVRSMSSMESRASYALPHFILSDLGRTDSQAVKTGLQHVVEKLDYQASSPDEKALLLGCSNLGLVYMGDENDIIKLQICPPNLDYTKPYALLSCREINFIRLNVIEFTSERKRMSIIIKDVNGEIWIYTKGAESFVLPLCSQELNGNKIDITNQHVDEFARLGLRTLVIARRKLTPSEYHEFKVELSKANNDLTDRVHLTELCYAKVERHLEILGATAVEDLLQDNLKESLLLLQRAGIKIWILTGDKMETALNIAIACGHIPENSQKFFIVECTNKNTLDLYLTAFEHDLNTNPNQLRALLIDGISLTLVLKEMPDRFRDIAIRCNSVLCCRLSPLQKCEIVQLVKATKKPKYITAAIGDGANDVSMIQEAHIGIGIVGKEGRQAARCADFAIARFDMLPRLALVHGHYSNIRLSLLIMYFFYKEIVFMGIQLIYQFHSMFSSISIYDSIFMTLFNVVYTALPILYISLTEKNYSEEVLMTQPELYKRNIYNRGLRWSSFLLWQLVGVYHSLVCFYVPYYVYQRNNNIFEDGQIGDFSTFGVILIQNVVIVTNFKIWFETTYQSYFFICIIWISIAAFMLTTYIYNIINIRLDTDIYWSYNNLLSNLIVYLIILLVVVAALLPDFTMRISKLALNIPKKSIFPGNAKNILQKKLQRHNVIAPAPANPVESTYL